MPVTIDASEVKQAFTRLRNEIPDEIARLGRPLVDQTLSRVKQKIPTGPPAGGHVESAYYTGITNKEPYIAWDREKFPYSGWLQHGGTRGRDYVKSGRWFFPEVGGYMRPEAVKMGIEAVTNIVKRYNMD